MTEEIKRFLEEHENDDIFQLRLKSSKYTNIDFGFAMTQLIGRQKIKIKVPLFYLNFDIHYPNQLSLEQSSSQITAQYKSTLCNGNSLVDLTGGFGIDCCFMSENFNEVVYVERQKDLCKLSKHNFTILSRKNINVINTESVRYLNEMEKVDWIFIDPARRSSIGKKVILLSDCEPDVTQISTILLEKASQIMIKLSPMLDISTILSDMQHISEIHIISVENECKEILLILNQKIENNTKIITINFKKNIEKQLFEFSLSDELLTQSTLSTELKKYLYEPNASIMKSGAFKLIGSSFNLDKLHTNTHLYTSDILKIEFPGRIFEIIKVWDSSKKALIELGNYCKKANIATRNYPISVAEIRKKVKIQDGGDIYLFACTNSKNEKVIIECIKAS